MRKSLPLTIFAILTINIGAFGQQDPMFTKYFFNSLIFNPAVAGNNGHLTANLIHRSQWFGVDGAPSTQSLSVHSPLNNERIGLGLSVVNDKIGASGTLDINTAYAYRFPLGEKMTLAVGLQAGVSNWRGNWSKLTLEDGTDEVFSENLNRWLPNFGAGLYLSSERFFAGAGCPRILEYDLREETRTTTYYAKSYRHFYTIVGAAFPLGSEQVVLRPSALLKSTGWFSKFRKYATPQDVGSPTELDLDLSCFFNQAFWLGVAYRTALELGDSSNDSADIWAAFYFRNGVRIGAAYDLTLSELNKVSNGSFEIMAGYEFNVKIKRVASPRYF
ncbi:MAG TPA: type IX secretion system membrane protein PorP/SprF [Saprospiraceae bacterium]|nr:type IX secretion system membrane protein PorP/SprF [Saprospiraceae bacterium]